MACFLELARKIDLCDSMASQVDNCGACWKGAQDKGRTPARATNGLCFFCAIALANHADTEHDVLAHAWNGHAFPKSTKRSHDIDCGESSADLYPESQGNPCLEPNKVVDVGT